MSSIDPSLSIQPIEQIGAAVKQGASVLLVVEAPGLGSSLLDAFAAHFDAPQLAVITTSAELSYADSQTIHVISEHAGALERGLESAMHLSATGVILDVAHVALSRGAQRHINSLCMLGPTLLRMAAPTLAGAYERLSAVESSFAVVITLSDAGEIAVERTLHRRTRQHTQMHPRPLRPRNSRY